MNSIFPLGFLFLVFLFGKVYPKETMITLAVVSMLVVAYFIARDLQLLPTMCT